MSSGDSLPPATRPFSLRSGSRPLTAADAERLLARRRADPEAPAVQQTLAGLLERAAGPSTGQELSGQVAAVAAFMLVTRQHDMRPGHGPSRFRALVRNRLAVAAGIGTAVVVAFSGAAAANALPAPVQELAHTTFGAPAPRHPASQPQPARPAARPVPSASPAPGTRHGKATATGKKAAQTGAARGKAKGRTVPPGHQKG